MHVRDTKALGWTKKIPLWAIRDTKKLRVEGLIYNVKGHQGHKTYIRDITSTRVKNVYIFKLGVVRKHGGKNIKDVRKAQMFFESNKRRQKRLHGCHKH